MEEEEEERRAEAAAAAAAAATTAGEEDEEEKEEEGPCQPTGRTELHRESLVRLFVLAGIAADAIPSSISLRCVSRCGPDPGAIGA